MIKTNYKNKIGTSGDIMAASKIIKEIKQNDLKKKQEKKEEISFSYVFEDCKFAPDPQQINYGNFIELSKLDINTRLPPEFEKINDDIFIKIREYIIRFINL